MNKDLPENFFFNIARMYSDRYVDKENVRKAVIKFGQFIDKALKSDGEVQDSLTEKINEKN